MNVANPVDSGAMLTALEAIEAALGGNDGIIVLKSEVVTIGAASAKLKTLLAATAYDESIKQVSIIASDAWSLAVGAAATMGAVTLDGGVLYQFGLTADTDLRVIAGGNVSALVIQEG